ncbi:CIA30-domain-containing protein, partial [Microthyrium microscopicum]
MLRPTARLLSEPGFVQRSVEEFKRLSLYAMRFEGMRIPKRPYPLVSFGRRDYLDKCKTMSDSDMGGYSSSNIEFVQPDDSEPGHLRFFGSVSTELPAERPNLKGAGYVGFRTKDPKRNAFGKGFWDIDQYTFLAIRLKSDGRKYLVNLQSDGIEPTDLHQHRIYAKRPGEWETLLIDWSEFVRTNHGLIAEPQSELLRQKVTSIGFSLVDRIPGPFDLRVQRMWATNGLQLEEEAKNEQGILTGFTDN